MKLNRRTLLSLAGATAVSTLGGTAFAKPKPKKVLILGGTGFIGPHFVKALMDGGHTVTLFNRGKRDPEARSGVEQLLGDRDGKLEALANRSWDAVIDDSGFFPRVVRLTAELLKPRVPQYIFVSSIAAYADFAKPGIDESYARAKLEDPRTEERNGKTYGPLKAACEDVVNEVYGRNATIIRPTFIAGPGDYTDRFTYWIVRVAQGGEMLAPGTATDPITYIDVRDLADFMRTCVERHATGPYNLVYPPGRATMGGLLDTCKRVTGANPNIAWASEEFLRAQGLISDELVATPSIPIWNPRSGNTAGLGLMKCDRAIAKGMRFRSIEQTVRDTFAWQQSRPPAEQAMKSGLKPDREAELLQLLKA